MFLSYTGVGGAGGMQIFWWRGEYSADDNTVRIGLLEHSSWSRSQKYCKLHT